MKQKILTIFTHPVRQKILLCLVLLFVTVTVFLGQNRSVGFEKGHHGWVSAHGLAIISKANWDNGFVGYTLQFKNEAGQIQHYYFERYPAFFSATMNQILSLLGNNLPMRVSVARQAMNLIFVITMGVAWLLLDKLIKNRVISLSVILVVFSNYLLLHYKDMVHFDQPGLLGFLFLILAIAIYKLNGTRWLLYVATVVAVSGGRGYASVAVLILWAFLESLRIAKASGFNLYITAKTIIKHDAFIALVVGVIWAGTLLAYNIYSEAGTRDVSIYQTSIVDSALRRLSLKETFNTEHSEKLGWGNFTLGQIERIVDLVIPVGHVQLGRLKYLILVPLLIIVPRFVNRQKKPKKIIMLIMIFSGFFWLFPMKNLAAFHDYTLMFYIGISLIFYLALFSFKIVERYAVYLLLLSALLFFAAHFLANRAHNAKAEQVNDYTDDFDKISQIIEPEKNIHYPEGHRNVVSGVPYVTGFYLPESFIAPIDIADYIISSDRHYQKQSLTPTNKKFFLFENKMNASVDTGNAQSSSP